MDTQEVREHIEHAAGHEHHAAGGGSKRVALLISMLAALLALTELGANSAQNEYNALNVQTNDVWAFYQAKTIRMSVEAAAADIVADLAAPSAPPERRAALQDQAARLRAQVQKLDSDPAAGQGRAELLAQAHGLETARDRRLAAYHAFEYGAAALQLGVVLASAGLLTGAVWLIGVAASLGGVALVLDAIGWFLPELMHHVV